MEKETNLPGLSLVNQYVKYVDFESKIMPTDALLKVADNAKIDIELLIEAANFRDDLYEVVIKADINSYAPNGRELFSLKLIYAGVFRLADVPAEDLDMVLLIYCPSIIFPFMRRAVYTMVSDGGFPPLMLDLVDFSKLYYEREGNK